MTHTTFREDVATYLTGGLPADDAAEFESHATDCSECATILSKAKQTDAALHDLFTGVFPGEGFEDRLVAGLRSAPHRRINPFVRAAAAAAAAAVILGAVGYLGGNRLNPHQNTAEARAKIGSNLRLIGPATKLAFTNSNWSDFNGFDAGRSARAADLPTYFADSELDGDTKKTPPGSTINLVYGLSGGENRKRGESGFQFQTTPNSALGHFDSSGSQLGNNPTNGPVAVKDSTLMPVLPTYDGKLGDNLHAGFEAKFDLGKSPPPEQKQVPLLAPTRYINEAGKTASNEGAREKTGDKPEASGVDNSAPASTQPLTDNRKVIRTGTMDFEVESFDSAASQISKIVAEEKGFVASTDSEKLPNGKVKGLITLRCPPEHLDALVMKLRALGDLKTQKISAQDVTKQFTDFASELRAARAMESWMLDIIKTGKGTVKDLVEAEKQLGVYREKIERVEGELRFMNSQVALSTLTVSLTERDIRSPFAAVQTEQVNAGIEAEDVDKARAEAIKLIEEAKGRVIESDLKKMDAGQLAATIVADVSSDAAGPLGDKLKLLGHVARWEAERKQTAQGGNEAPGQLPPNARLEKQATHFNLSIYNLADVAPRQRTGLTLVTGDVQATYRSLLAAVNGNGKNPPIGRIIASSLNSEKSDQISGSITLEVKTDQAPAIEAALHSAGSVMHVTVTDSSDANVTTTKVGYGIAIISSANVPAREQQTLAVASKDVEATYNKLIALLRDPKQSAHVASSQLVQQDEGNVTGSVDFEIPLSARAAVEAVLSDGKQSDVTTRNVVRAADTENTLADKLRLTVTITAADRLPPREAVKLALEVPDVQKALDIAAGVGGSDTRVLERTLNQQPDGASVAHVVIDVPLGAAAATLDELRSLGKIRASESSKNPAVTPGPLARARFEVVIGNTETLVAPQDGVGFSIRAGLKKALAGLLWSVQMVVTGLVLVGPFALVGYVVWKLARRRKAKPA